MLQLKSKKPLLAMIAVLVLLAVVIGVIAFVRANSDTKEAPRDTSTSVHEDDAQTSDEATPRDTSTSVHEDDAQTSDEAAETKQSPVTPETENAPALDPATVSTIDIQPMEMRVSFVKGIGGFEYEVLQTPSGTKYVSFVAPELGGTKCTDDNGAFASIIERPADDESASISKRTVVDGVSYGLSLADETCTSNPELLKAYQASFSDAFSLLAPIE